MHSAYPFRPLLPETIPREHDAATPEGLHLDNRGLARRQPSATRGWMTTPTHYPERAAMLPRRGCTSITAGKRGVSRVPPVDR